MNTLLAHIVEQGTQPGELVRRADAVSQRVAVDHGRARVTCSLVKRGEVLTGDGSCQQAAQRFAATTFGSHARSQCVDLAERGNRAASFVAGAGPHVALHLAGQGSHGALMLEPVAMFVRTLAAGVVAIETGTARAASDREFGGAP